MKKRITALLLCLVMVFSLIPTTVWAANMSWTWTVTVFGGNYCKKDGTESNTNRYTVNRSLDNSVEHEIGYKFQWVKGAGAGTYDGGWQLCLTVDGKVVEESSAYIFSRDMQNASGTWTTPTSSHTGTSSHPFTLSLSSFPKAEPNTPEVPAPVFDKIFGNDTVRVTDQNTTSGHGTKTYSLMDGRYTSVKNSDIKYTIIVEGADYIKDYQNTFPGVTHTTVDDGDKTITLNYKNNTWVPDPSSVTFTVKCEEEEQPVGPGDTKPNFADVDGKIKVECIASPANHTPTWNSYNITDGTYTDNGSTVEGGTYTYSISLNRASFIQKFDADTGYTHTDKAPDEDTRITWTWDAAKGWELNETAVVIKCECEKEEPGVPDAPTIDEIGKGNLVTVKCLNPTTGKNDCTDCKYGLKAGMIDGYELEKVNDYSYLAKIPVTAFVNAYLVVNGNKIHHDLYSADTLTYVVTYDRAANKWTARPQTEGVDNVVYVTHAPTKWQEVSKIGGAINATCTTSSYGPISYGLTTAFVYYDTDVVSVVFDGNGTYTATIKTDKYVDAIAKACNGNHHKDDPRAHKLTSGNETVQWKFQVAQNEGKYSWSAAPVTDKDGAITVSHELFVKFQPENGEADFTQNVYGGEKAVKPNDPTRAGYTFLGWYLGETEYDFDTPVTEDITLTGKWEIVQYTITYDYRDKDITNKTHLQPDNPTTYTVLDTITLNPITAKGEFGKVFWEWRDENNNPITEIPAGSTGDRTISAYWQYPVNYTVYVLDKDGNKVETTRLTQYFNEGTSAEYSLMALPTKDGYTFSGWYQSEKDMNNGGAVITGLTGDKKYELYGKFEITPHTVYAYTRLKSAFFNLTPDEFGDSLKLNNATLDRLGLGSYNENGFISIGSFVFKDMPLTDDMYMSFYEDPELDAAVAALKQERNIDLDLVNKIDWTVLYKTENENDMAPGYPTEDKDSYQLSGNLNLSAVMFQAGGENVENMPAVNYSKNSLEVYDFYFAGDTFTMPADPTREGYTFLGWKAQIIPTEDLMLLENTNANEESKLYKAGDEYTIPAGDVVFVAQWQVNVYTVSFDSNGGSKVDDQLVEYRKTVTEPKKPTRPGYTFRGWFIDEKCTEKYDFSSEVTSDMTLYAKWRKKPSGSTTPTEDTTKTGGKKVESGKTFDAGIGLYVGLSILSATGSAVVITKKKRG